MRLKDISQLNPKYEGKLIDGDVSFVPMESLRCGSIDLQEIAFSEAKGKYTYFANNDLLIAKVTPCFENGNIAIAKDLKEGIGFGSSEIFVLRTNKLALNTYIFYVSQTSNFQDAACATMCGVGGLKRISPLIMRTYELDVPSIETQHKIVSYLDEKCGAIDVQVELLEKKRKANERLKKSIINDAVTHGLNPNVTMRPSGIDMIGDIPAHWSMKRIKDVAEIFAGATPSSKNESYWDGDIVWVTPADMTDFGYIKSGTSTITDLGYSSCGTHLVPAGSIIISSRAPIGKVNIASQEMCTNQGCKSLVLNKSTNVKYIAYYLYNQSINIDACGQGTTFKELSLKNLVCYNVIFPPLEEQKAIAAYLDEKCGEIDATVENIGKQIDAYKRLKRALINEVVTGKRAV